MNQFEQSNQFAQPQNFVTSPHHSAAKVIEVEITDEPVIVRQRNQIIRDAPRYVVTAGDLLTPTKKLQLQAFSGSAMGGMWFDGEEIPSLWRTQGFVLRGRITPLLKRPQRAFSHEEIHVKKTGDKIEEVQQAREVPGVFRPSYPYDSMISLIAFAGRKGLVAVEELEGIDYGSGIIQQIQEFITPDARDFLTGQKKLPLLLDEFERYIDARRAATSETLIRAVCEAFLRSAQAFRKYANEIIDFNRLGYDRGVSPSGFRQRITEVARLYAAQLGRRVDPQDSQQIIVQSSPAALKSEAELELERKRLELEERRLAVEEARLGLRPAAPVDQQTRTETAAPVETPAPVEPAAVEEVSIDVGDEIAEIVGAQEMAAAPVEEKPKGKKKNDK